LPLLLLVLLVVIPEGDLLLSLLLLLPLQLFLPLLLPVLLVVIPGGDLLLSLLLLLHVLPQPTKNPRHPERSCSRHFVSNAVEGSLYLLLPLPLLFR
jgi:hypothetical protein